MKAVVVYEPSFGSTPAVARAIALGIDRSVKATLLPASEADRSVLDDADLLVVGSHSQCWGTARAGNRASAARHVTDAPQAAAVGLAAWSQPGMQEWLSSLGQVQISAAAFDTRTKGYGIFTVRIAKTICRDLRRHGMTLIVPPASFLVDETGHFVPGETLRAEAWGANLGGALRTRRAAV